MLNTKDTTHIEFAAKMAHSVNKIYCESVGDNSQLPWDDAPEWQRKSAIEGVVFLINTPDAKPETTHESWLRTKEADGWVYGEVKDPKRKEHPCMVPYCELPKEQQAKDDFFLEVVQTLFGLKNKET